MTLRRPLRVALMGAAIQAAGCNLIFGQNDLVVGAGGASSSATSTAAHTSAATSSSSAETSTASTSSDTTTGTGAGGGPSFLDDFNRPDDDAIGNGWIEKSPSSFSIVSQAVPKAMSSAGYPDSLVYRPASEDLLDVETSIEFKSPVAGNTGSPQIFLRAQESTIATSGQYDGYLAYVLNTGGSAILGRQHGAAFVQTLGTLAVTVDTTDTYRLRFSAVGTDTVTLTLYVEQFDGAQFNVIAQGSAEDSSGERIATPGTTGFSADFPPNVVYDNFRRTAL